MIEERTLQLQHCMYQYSRAIYRSVKDLIDPYGDRESQIESRRAVLMACEQTMERLARDGVRRVAVVTPGFAADCLETLEEIAQENAEIFKHNGGEQFAAIPCLNDSDPGMDVIRQLVLRELQGWI